MPFSIRLKVLLGFGLAILAVGIIAFLSIQSTRLFIRTAEWVSRTHLVLETHESMLRHLMEAESAARGYLISGDELLLNSFQQAAAEGISDAEALRSMLADQPGQRARLATIQKRMERKLRTLRDLIEGRGGDANARFSAMGQEGSMLELRSLMAEFELEEERLLGERAGLTHQIGKETMGRILLGSGATAALLLVALALILHDIAARRRAEALLAQERNLLRSLIDAIPDHIFVKDPQGRYVLDNVAHRRFLNLSDPDQLVGRTASDFFPKEIAAIYDADDQSVLSSGNPILNREEPAATAEGKMIWLSTTKVPLRDVTGQRLIGLVCVNSDISERKLAEEKMRVFAAQLERSNGELRDFASVASHDLQEPLRKIQAFADRLRLKCADALEEQGLDYLERIQNAAGRMQTLIQDLLTLSYVTSRAQPFVQVDLGEVLQGVLSDLEVRIEQDAAKIEVGPMATIDADPVQMRQLFQNLLSNALKFHKPGQPPEVTISARVVPAPEQALAPGTGQGEEICQIVVADNGIGFDEQYVEQVFTLFQRLHSREEYEGTGIGLAVCRKIAHRHGGSIVAKSEKGQGATFIIKLPVKQITKS
ncbi:MAG: CHASE3 domain-containing protein [Verrucomicrobia bacterium]|nr:CHASE3 domain-containing protein [Verrucomicrobiota bacterium]